MTESRNLGPRESILSDSHGVTRPRAPPRSATPERPGRQRGPSIWPVVGLPRRGLGNLRRGRKSWFPNRNTAARSATASSSPSAHELVHGHSRPRRHEEEDPGIPRSPCQSTYLKPNDLLSALRAVAYRSRREPGSAGLRRNPVYSGTRCREPPAAAAH